MAQWYAERSGGVITGLYARPQPGRAEELVSDEDAEVIAFYTTTRRKPRAVASLVSDIRAWVGTDPARLRKVASLALALALRMQPGAALADDIPVVGDEPVSPP